METLVYSKCGLAVVNALSDEFIITSYREDEKTKHELIFREGEKVSDKFTSNKSGKHGSFISFRPSIKYLGEGTCIPVENVCDWIDSLFYLDSSSLKTNNIKCKVEIYDGNMKVDTIIYKPKPFEKLLDKVSNKKKCSSSIYLTGSDNFKEMGTTIVMKNGSPEMIEKMMDKNVHIDVAIRYSNEPMTIWDTYCNDTNTTEHGTHKDVVEKVYCRYMQSAVNKSMSDSEKKRLSIIWDDIRDGLVCVLNLSTNLEVGFIGNAKQEINCPQSESHITEIVQRELDRVFTENEDILKQYIKIIKLNCKARLEAIKAKNVTKVNSVDNFKAHQMKNYIPCNNTGKNDFRELFIIEGNSAASGVRNACDPQTQSAFLLRGVTFNPFKASLSKAMENREFHDLVTVLKCGIGEKFDINKLYFDRINILTDADVDGFYISSGVLAFFYKYLRPIIESGKLYKVYSPLYQLEDKEYPFVASKVENVEIYHKKINKTYKVELLPSKKKLSKAELQQFLEDTYDYRDSLITLAESSGRVNKFLIECIVANLILSGFIKYKSDGDFVMKDPHVEFKNQKFVKNLMIRIQEKFKEIKVDDCGNFTGVVDGKFCSVSVTHRLFKKAEDLIPIIINYGYKLNVINRNTSNEVVLTIGEFLDYCQPLISKILIRFKGLGELNAKDLKKTTMDINNRVSVQFTVDDVKRELAIFHTTHGGSSEDSAKRKKLLKEFKIKQDELDN